MSAPEFHRGEIEAEIERLIGILDALDDDPDLEPSLGDNGSRLLSNDWVDLEGSDADEEPSLGSCDAIFSQGAWSFGGMDDFEDEHDGREPCCEEEGDLFDDERTTATIPLTAAGPARFSGRASASSLSRTRRRCRRATW
jgi:hypothetical protein